MTELRAACADRDLEHRGWPTVSVVMPIRNEAPHLERAVASILGQDYPRPVEVCLAVAPSDDATEQVAAAIAERRPEVRVVANAAGSTPAGLNAAIAATTGEVVVRVDGHAALSPGYIRRAVETMCRTGAVNVGGRQVPAPQTPFEAAVAAVTTSWLGTGGATYRVGGGPGPVDTVYLGVFDRAAGAAVGWFDERLVRNQDYELNIRLRDAGGTVWFDPDLAVDYRPRGTVAALARQYFEYGYWKAAVIRAHPGSARPRQLAPPLAAAVALAAAATATGRRLLAVAAGGYVVTALTTSGPPRRRVLAVAAAATIHASWTAGLVLGAIRSPVAVRRGSAARRSST